MTAQSSPQSPETQLTPGSWLDRYELLAPVAQGGFGQVWLGRLRGKRGFEKLVAIKVPRLNGDNSLQEMLLDEARIASSIDHDNVAKIIELGEQGEILYIVMEWIDGEPISTLLRALDKTKTPFPIPIALRLIGDMCSAAHAAHELRAPDGTELGVVHRDISPQNMLITAAGTVKLIDFGIAKARDRAAGDTTDGTLKGKIKYMAPEQALGRTVDRRTDVFALGAVLYRLLTGQAPYEAENEVATIHKLATGTPAPPLPESFPQPVRNIVARALSLTPGARFRTALDMQAAILEAMAMLNLKCESPQIAEFVEIHLKDRLSKRRAAIELALKAAADRTTLGEAFPGPVSSSSSSLGRNEYSGGTPPSGHSNTSSGSQSVGGYPTVVESSNVSQVTGPQFPPEIAPPQRLKWLWALAVGAGALGVVMIVLVATRTKAPTTPLTTNAATAPSSSSVSAPVLDVPSAEPTPSVASATPSAVTSVAAKPVIALGKPTYVAPKPKPKPTGSAKPSGTTDFGY